MNINGPNRFGTGLIRATIFTLMVHGGGYLHAITPSWHWDSPRDPINTTIFEAKPGRTILYANIAYLENGELIAFNEHSHYGGDTNVTGAKIQWHRSSDSGYPKAVTLPDGSVYAVYLFRGIRSMSATRFHPLHPQFEG